MINSKILIVFVVLVTLSACKESAQNPVTFQGEPKAVQLAEQMFEAIGGQAAWCELKSLYIKAEHEPLSIPYLK